MAKRRQFFYQNMNQWGLNAEIAKDVSAFYVIMVLFVDMFYSEFVESLWFSLSTSTNWEPNAVLWNENRPIGDWRKRASLTL